VVFSSGAVPDISVVVPAFNVEAYLLECLTSIAEQEAFEVCEVIVVDDGSTDGTFAVAEAAARQFSRIVTVQQPNAGPGPGAARNVGLSRARGRYVMFLDGDDMIAPGGLDALFGAAEQFGSDLVVGPLATFPIAKSYPWDSVFAAIDRPVSVPIEQVAAVIHNPAPGNKLMRVSALRRLGLTFAEGIHHQDTYVTIPLMLESAAITLVPQVVQRYRVRPGSIMDSHFTRRQNYFDHLQVVEHLARLRPDLDAARQSVLDAFLVRSMQGFVLRASELGQRSPEFVERAAAVYANIPTSAFFGATASINHRLAYAALMSGDAAALAASPSPVRRVFAYEGLLFAGDGDDDGAAPDPLTRVGALVATLDSLDVDADTVTARGTVRVNGVVPVHQLPVRVSFRLRGAGRTVTADLDPSPDGATTIWRARWATSEVADGAFATRIVLETATGQASTATRSTAPIPALRQGERTWQVLAEGESARQELRVSAALT
jgi:hypothetical protein